MIEPTRIQFGPLATSSSRVRIAVRPPVETEPRVRARLRAIALMRVSSGLAEAAGVDQNSIRLLQTVVRSKSIARFQAIVRDRKGVALVLTLDFDWDRHEVHASRTDDENELEIFDVAELSTGEALRRFDKKLHAAAKFIEAGRLDFQRTKTVCWFTSRGGSHHAEYEKVFPPQDSKLVSATEQAEVQAFLDDTVPRFIMNTRSLNELTTTTTIRR